VVDFKKKKEITIYPSHKIFFSDFRVMKVFGRTCPIGRPCPSEQ
jgi:hypothetical protein